VAYRVRGRLRRSKIRLYLSNIVAYGWVSRTGHSGCSEIVFPTALLFSVCVCIM
jgi:hypothetical protein